MRPPAPRRGGVEVMDVDNIWAVALQLATQLFSGKGRRVWVRKKARQTFSRKPKQLSFGGRFFIPKPRCGMKTPIQIFLLTKMNDPRQATKHVGLTLKDEGIKPLVHK